MIINKIKKKNVYDKLKTRNTQYNTTYVLHQLYTHDAMKNRIPLSRANEVCSTPIYNNT